MSNFDKLISSLECVKNTGSGKHLARCPAHNDKSPSLAIKLTDDGKILIHCFAGCAVDEILGVIGMTLSDLMPDNPAFKHSGKIPKFNKYELFNVLVRESGILLVAIRQLSNGIPLSDTDSQRVMQAECTIDDIISEVSR